MTSNLVDFPSAYPDSLPPQNIDAEQAVLGSILLDPNSMQRIGEILEPDAFYVHGHGLIYSACCALHSSHQPVDLQTVTSWLSDHNLLSAVGGKMKMVQLLESTVTSINVDALAQLVAEKAISRRMMEVGQEIIALGRNQAQELNTRLDAAQQKVFALHQQRHQSNQPELVANVSLRVFQQMEQLALTGAPPAIASGFYDLDHLLAGGFYPEDLIVVGGRPSMGKSLLACSMAYQIAARSQMPTLIFSLEMSADAIVQRYVSNLAQIEGSQLRQGKILAHEWTRVAKATDTLSQVPVLIDDTPCPSVEQIRSKVRATISQYKGLKLVVIDYLQLMVDGGDSRLVQRLGEITRQLKLLARECKVPILLLSQLNRGVEDRSNKRPFQSDLRDSGRIEEDADVILFCYREQYYNPSTTERGVMEVICTKQRNGPTGTVKLLFDGSFNRLRNLASK
jgi:replicative DNA helicase